MKTIIEKQIDKKTEAELVDITKNQLIVNLSVKCNEGTFDISKILYEIPVSIRTKTPADYTEKDVEILEHLKSVKKVTKTIAKPLIPKTILEDIKKIQYEVRKQYLDMILMPEMPIMSVDNLKKLQQSIDEADKAIESYQESMELLWDENLVEIEKDLREAYPEAPSENIEKIMNIAKEKKRSVIGRQGFKLSISVLPSSEAMDDTLKSIVASQNVDTIHMIFEDAIKEAFDNVSYVYLAPKRQEKRLDEDKDETYLIHGKTMKRIPTFSQKFKRKMFAIGLNNVKEIKEIHKSLNSLAKDKEIVYNENKIIEVCGKVTYMLIKLAKNNDIVLDIPSEINLEILEATYF